MEACSIFESMFLVKLSAGKRITGTNSIAKRIWDFLTGSVCLKMLSVDLHRLGQTVISYSHVG